MEATALTLTIPELIPLSHRSYVICVYCDDSWSKDDVGRVLQVLIRDLGLTVSAYKTDANVSGLPAMRI